VSKACILIVFETIWNCRENIENNVSKACILTYLKRFRITEIFLKIMSLKHAI